ncbi:MAG: methyl-accepting chemotaxis protein [Pseudomonadota bacterium]
MRLSSAFLLVFVILGLFMTTLGGYTAYQSVRELRDVRQAAQLGKIETTAVSATVAMSLERSVIQVALAFPGPVPSEFRDIVSEQRSTADIGLAEALRQVELVTSLPTRQDYINQTQNSLQRVAELRQEVDALLAVPIVDRDPARSYQLPLELKREVVNLKNATELLGNREGVGTPVTKALRAVQLKSWEVREFGGRARTYFAIATLNQETISEADLAVSTLNNGRAEEAWYALGNSVRNITGLPSNITQDIAAAEEVYFQQYGSLVKELEDVSRATPPGEVPNYAINFPDFFVFSNTALGVMEDLSQDSGDTLVSEWQSIEKKAIYTALASCSFALISLVGLITIYFSLKHRVFGLFGATTRILKCLASGDVNVRVRENRKEHQEIRELAATVSAFQETLAVARAAEAEAKEAAERQRESEAKQARKERDDAVRREEQAAKSKAEAEARQKRESRAAAEIAEVVEACAAGDFGRRLTVDDKDGIFREICDGMNRIGEIADAGLGEVRVALGHIANGDLTYRMPRNFSGIFEDIAQTMNHTAASLSETLQNVTVSAEKVDGTSTEITALTEDGSARSNQVASSLEQTAAELDQMTNLVQSAENSAQTARAAVEDIAKMAKTGNDVVIRTISAMNEIESSSDEISKVLQVIDEIAFQTNLLALNAGVEAARAGDAGRGFAIVASEVRALAQRSSVAAKKIADLVETSTGNVRSGVELVNSSGEALKTIVAGVDDATQKLHEIVSVSNDTSTGIQEIARSTAELDTETQQNVAVFTETNEAVLTLRAEASNLTAAVAAFRLATAAGDGGSANPEWRHAS